MIGYGYCSYALNASLQVQEKRDSGQRLKLKISIQAPEITIPLKSDSNEVVVADLGSLSLTNTSHIAKKMEVTTDSGVEHWAAVYEKYTIELNNLQIYRYMYMYTVL